MAGRFTSFVILADMRTGSNHLEARLNAYPGLESLGELFNPVFVGRDGQTAGHGIDLAERDADPLGFLERVRARTEGLPGFRLFPGHAPRVLDACLADPACAKIVLTRNPLDSYISLKIARATGQWWMGDGTRRRRARVRFDDAEFRDELDRRAGFYEHVRRALMKSGQTAFQVRYGDLGDDAVIAGVARYLGVDVAPLRPVRAGQVQNPEPAIEKVDNPGEMTAALQRLDLFGLLADPDFEPRRGPNLRTWLVSDALRLIYLPVPGGPTESVRAWLTEAAGAVPRDGLTRREIWAWKADRPGHRTLTVVSHPLVRAWRGFHRHIVAEGPQRFTEILHALEKRYGMVLPDTGEGPEALRAPFLAFLGFLKLNLAGQTSVRVPAVWASQTAFLSAMADVAIADLVVREDDLPRELARLTGREVPFAPDGGAGELAVICDDEIERAARAACHKDYTAFGFGPWHGPGGNQAA